MQGIEGWLELQGCKEAWTVVMIPFNDVGKFDGQLLGNGDRIWGHNWNVEECREQDIKSM